MNTCFNKNNIYNQMVTVCFLCKTVQHRYLLSAVSHKNTEPNSNGHQPFLPRASSLGDHAWAV